MICSAWTLPAESLRPPLVLVQNGFQLTPSQTATKSAF